MDPISNYLAQLQAACSSGDAPRPEVMDNTAHVGSCSMAAAPGVVGVLIVIMLLRKILCPQRLRQTYSGAEDAPELEAITCDDGSSSLRCDSYAIREGRLASARPSSSSRESKPKPKGKKKASNVEMEPVLSWKR